ncbi:sulfatase [Candidatus Poribacteria bacterium]
MSTLGLVERFSCFKRREFIKIMVTGLGGIPMAERLFAKKDERADNPNIILCMTDDQGWGDTGYNEHPILKTPNLDRMANEGIQFNRFYSGAPVCSPTRGSCLTGRHPYRYGIFFANEGHMKREEITLAEVLKAQGYITGHFGKWHLGTLTTKIKDSNRGRPGDDTHYSPPWENGFDVCFSTEAKVPTWDPMRKPTDKVPNWGWEYLKQDDPAVEYGTHYWDGPDSIVTDNLSGDDSRIIMDRAIPFIEGATAKRQPFFAVIWFHAPHLPVVTGAEYARSYGEFELYKRNYYGCITAMDAQMGRLLAKLEELGAANNTMLWFCSDNGPEGKADSAPGSAGILRGRKRSLYEGGVRVPGLLIWPDRIAASQMVNIPCVTSDYFPTVMDVLGYRLPAAETRPYDGISLLPLIDGQMTERPRPIGFESRRQVSLTDNRYKIYSPDDGETFELYDLIEDPSEENDLAVEKPDIVSRMSGLLNQWRQSCLESNQGRDYR